MENVILCNGRYAQNPYLLEEENLRIYSVEELCYFLPLRGADRKVRPFMRSGSQGGGFLSEYAKSTETIAKGIGNWAV